MHQVSMKGLLVVACLLASPLVSAAGFDCTQVKAGIDKRICDDATLLQLDDHMTASYAQARTRARSNQHLDALLRDQRNWLSKRNAAIALGPKFAADTYQERIRFLDHLFLEPNGASQLLSAIATHFLTAPSAAKDGTQVGDWWARIGGDCSVA